MKVKSLLPSKLKIPVTGKARIFQKLVTGKNPRLVFVEVPVTT